MKTFWDVKSRSLLVRSLIIFYFLGFQEEPKKVCFNYDLFLNLEGNPPVNHLRCEKLTFNNPTKEFRRKLVRAGGVSGRWTPDRSGIIIHGHQSALASLNMDTRPLWDYVFTHGHQTGLGLLHMDTRALWHHYTWTPDRSGIMYLHMDTRPLWDYVFTHGHQTALGLLHMDTIPLWDYVFTHGHQTALGLLHMDTRPL